MHVKDNILELGSPSDSWGGHHDSLWMGLPPARYYHARHSSDWLAKGQKKVGGQSGEDTRIVKSAGVFVPLLFTALVTITNLIESPFLWIYKIEHKMVQAMPAWSAVLFSVGWQFLIFAPLPLPSYLLLYQLNRMLVWKAGNVEPKSHNLDNRSAILVYQVSRIERILLCVRLQRFEPMTLTSWWKWRLPDVDRIGMTDHIWINVDSLLLFCMVFDTCERIECRLVD
jgi:hypothetical protein